MALRTIDSLGDLRGRRVIVRCDLNVPLKDGVIGDDGRIRASLGTLSGLREAGARVVVISHLGRPDGTPDEKYSLRPVAARLGELLGADVAFATDTVGDSARAAVEALGDGEVVVLENLRFHAEETSKDEAVRRGFAESIAEPRGCLRVRRLRRRAPQAGQRVRGSRRRSPAPPGRSSPARLEVLDRLTENPERPYTVVLGGSKVSDKLGVIGHLLPRVDSLLIGGGMLFTFLRAQGHEVGASLLEEDQVETVKGYLAEAEERGVKIVLPTDVVVADGFSADAAHEVTRADAIEETPAGAKGLGLDIGPETADAFATIIRGSTTVFWNGPMGVFELEPFAAGTKTVADALTRVEGLSVVGGGDSAAAVRALGFDDDRFGHISTGGGASLEFLEGKRLPGLEVLGWQ
ncbi:phosphoglycerate kinase [Clavibacter tessellarius]|uniref:phosphoglycerate kinase n=1 Tax=Clavibacter tessellarius TaxID=31965 RepID=UPI00324778BE